MTLEEFLEADVVEGYRYESARGVLEVTQVPNYPHRQVVTNLYDAIGRYRRMRLGVVLSYRQPGAARLCHDCRRTLD